MSGTTAGWRFNIAQPLMQASSGKRCPFHKGAMAFSSA
jgi:hypothetical protein